MGNAQVPRVDEPRAFLGQYNDLVYQEALGSYKLFKVLQCIHEREGPVIAKLFVYRDGAGAADMEDVKKTIMEVKESFRSHWLHPNVVPYQAMEVADRSALLLRQHFALNLADRLHSRPFLTAVMQKWIAFQVLCGVCQAHAVGIAHGDLKTENVFVSSWQHILVTDFATFKPFLLPVDDPTQFSFFFESTQEGRRCYVAPERFQTGASASTLGQEPFGKKTMSIDVFSAGCVLSELFSGGQILFDLPDLLTYRTDQSKSQAKISKIKEEAIQKIITHMITPNPEDRLSGIEYLEWWCEKVCPKSFRTCLFPLFAMLLHPIYQQPAMRIILIRHNFANILWSIVGQRRIASVLARLEEHPLAIDGSVSLKQRWSSHIQKNVREIDEASLHFVVQGATQAAGHWQGLSGNFDFEPKSRTSQSPQHEPVVTQPWLDEKSCEIFSKEIFALWREGCNKSLSGKSGEKVAELEAKVATIYKNLLVGSSCDDANADDSGAPLEESSGDEVTASTSDDEDVLAIVASVICSSLQHTGLPRMKMICLEMFQQMAPFSSITTILELIIPYVHALMTDPIASVRAKAIAVLARVLLYVYELPASDAPLFSEYLFPQLKSAMSGGISGDSESEAVVLLSIANNIGSLAQSCFRLVEMSVAAVQRDPSGSLSGDQALTEASSPKLPQKAEGEAYDVQTRNLRQAVGEIVHIVLGSQSYCSTTEVSAESQEEHLEATLARHTTEREIKVALLRNMGVLADVFGREGTHNFLLPLLITFMNHTSWEVRAAFCEEAVSLSRKVGQISTMGHLWPCFDSSLGDKVESVLEAALKGLASLVSQQTFPRSLLVEVAKKAAPFLEHSSIFMRRNAVAVFESLHKQLTPIEQIAFVMPVVRKHLVAEGINITSLDMIGQALKPFSAKSRPSVVEDCITGLNQSLKDGNSFFMMPPGSLQGAQYAVMNPNIVANQSLQALSEFDLSIWDRIKVKVGGRHPLKAFSMNIFLTQALCLPPRQIKLGSLTALNGMPFSIYTTKGFGDYGDLKMSYTEVGHEAVASFPPRKPMGNQSESDRSSNISSKPSTDVSGMVSSERKFSSMSERRDRLSTTEIFDVTASSIEDIGGEHLRAGLHQSPWRPQGLLLATLYEYAHTSGVPVVQVDTTDDSRILITGGKDGVIKIWNCAALEKDVAVSSSFTFTVPSDSGKAARLRTMRTVRNSKGVAIGSESGRVLLYRVEPARGGSKAVEVSRLSSDDQTAAGAVLCLDQFDTALESLVVFAHQSGTVHGWDVRSHSPSWRLSKVPPWLGVPSAMALGSDGHAITVGTLGGGLCVYDLRFLAPWKTWRVSSAAPVLSLKSTNISSCPDYLGIFAALGSESNEVALFDVARGSCLTLFLTEPSSERHKETAVSVPSLVDASAGAAAAKFDGSLGITPEQLSSQVRGACRSAGCVKSLWLPPRGAQTFLLAGGSDRKVRYWSLDPERHNSEAYIITPPDTSGSSSPAKARNQNHVTHNSNHLGDVFVVQEQNVPADSIPGRSTSSTKSHEAILDETPEYINPNHRDAILDMCTVSLQWDILVTAGRDGLVKLWK